MQPMSSWPKCPPRWIALTRALTRTRTVTRKRPHAALAFALLAPAVLLPMPAAGAEDGARLAGTCTGCHGTNGNTVGDALPALAGQSRDALMASLAAFKAGERDATVMTQIAKGYSDEQLARIAAFFAAQQPLGAGGESGKTDQPPRPGAGS